ncbi:hypothetical protein GRS96_12425 [Rathayibacter sp. VKM Ac-2803]|uniref:hypothetical protein n=1 Tax=Rathayibacter sp. VKM Ac-2803 TaxID=2609256 RepID=UPI001356D93B|nr:hypothetical protein [Rathayibacter sp. VKM Ac-2803]MWV50075.1 hypothetical protein [Rathayibacter sp. VKM Ac-2803]
MAALAQAAAALRVVRIEAAVEELTSRQRVMVGHGGEGSAAEDADGVAPEHGSAEADAVLGAGVAALLRGASPAVGLASMRCAP